MGEPFRIDNKDPLYKKLIKLPTAYYRLKDNGNGYTIYSQNNGTVEIKNTHDVKLKWENNKIVLYERGSALKLQNGEDFIIEQEAIIGKDKEAIVKKLQETDIGIILQNIPGGNFGIELFISRSSPITGVLNFINLYDENDPVLNKIKKEEKGELCVTIEDDYIYIDKEGKYLPVCGDGSCYKYQYTKNECDVLTISDVSTIIKNLNKAEQCSLSEATAKAGQDFTLQQGKKLSDNIYQANIVLNDKPIATLPKIGYYMLDDQLVMRNHVTQEKVVIPRDFHYLKAIKFNNDDYKLTFCNFLGNEFFEYKKYDPQYSNVLDEYKFISLSCMKKKYNPNLGELLSHRPSFFIAEESAKPGSPGHYSVAVFEFISGKKGRKMATLIDEFSSFNKEGKFKYCDYHKKTQCDTYDSSEISLKEKYTWTDKNSEFCFVEDDNITLHTTPQELF